MTEYIEQVGTELALKNVAIIYKGQDVRVTETPERIHVSMTMPNGVGMCITFEPDMRTIVGAAAWTSMKNIPDDIQDEIQRQ